MRKNYGPVNCGNRFEDVPVGPVLVNEPLGVPRASRHEVRPCPSTPSLSAVNGISTSLPGMYSETIAASTPSN